MKEEAPRHAGEESLDCFLLTMRSAQALIDGRKQFAGATPNAATATAAAANTEKTDLAFETIGQA